MSGVTPIQRDALIKPIAPARVGRDGKGFSHIEAYDARRRLIEIFDFGGWSGEVLSMDLVFESNEQRTNKKGEEYTAWTVCYRCNFQLRIHATGAIYTESATGEATNQPSRGDAHDLALKTAESQAFKRAAMNLGSQFGLSLYAKGSTAPIVRHILVNDLVRIDAASGEITRPEGSEHKPGVDTADHVTEPVTPESGDDYQPPRPQQVKTSDRDLQEAARRGVTPEQERADRLAEQKVRRDALGVDSKGKTVKEEQGRVTRIQGRPTEPDPWAGRADPFTAETSH